MACASDYFDDAVVLPRQVDLGLPSLPGQPAILAGDRPLQ